ncbi:hypothetical protein Q9966_003602 [Columba livia]|nr:hypothetical protein Q9966_003602 [Columba livia]
MSSLWDKEPGLAPMLRSPALGSGRNFFPRGRLALVPGGFLPSSAALSMTTLQSSSGPFWLRSCLLLKHQEHGLSCPAAGGRKAFFSPRRDTKCLWGFFAFLCSIEHGPLPRLLWAIWAGCLLLHEVALNLPRTAYLHQHRTAHLNQP